MKNEKTFYKNTFLGCVLIIFSCFACNDDDSGGTDSPGTGDSTIILTHSGNIPIRSYKLRSSAQIPNHDPASCKIYGSTTGKEWILLDEQQDITFCARLQENVYAIKSPGQYTSYKLTINTNSKEHLYLDNIQLSETNPLEGWKDFVFPKIIFQNKDPNSQGSKYYNQLVQKSDEYIQYHALKVAEILFDNALEVPNIGTLQYILNNFNGISMKYGAPPLITIEFSTPYITQCAGESFTKLDQETRGILFHELTHAYQYEPQGIGDYSSSLIFVACVEGLADAVRAEAGYFDLKNQRKPGGSWLEGYQTFGFFIQWLTNKDSDAIRKFNKSVRDLNPWNIDGAMKYIFGTDASFHDLWEEYQTFIISENK